MSQGLEKTLKEILQEEKLSPGDNAIFLLKALGILQKVDLKKLENELGEVAKMSKSKANTVDPEQVVSRYGADTVRLYTLFAAPPERDFEWIESGIEGAYRFLNRLWDFTLKNKETVKLFEKGLNHNGLSKAGKDLRRKVHETILKFSREMERNYQFNTAIAAVMELLNELQSFKPQNEEDKKVVGEAIEAILKLLYPITPHVCEELWERLGKESRLYAESYPEVDQSALKKEEVEIPVQINGKVRAKITVPASADRDAVLEEALKNPAVRKHTEGKEIKKVIYVPGRLLNLVVG